MVYGPAAVHPPWTSPSAPQPALESGPPRGHPIIFYVDYSSSSDHPYLASNNILLIVLEISLVIFNL